jgi:hypothetical protein
MAQFLDSVSLKTGIEYHLSSQPYQPLWLVANRHGTVVDRQSDLVSFVRFSNKHVLAETEYQDEKGLDDYNDLSFSYGLSLYNNNHFRSTIIEEGYVKLEYKNWSLRAGRFEEKQNDPARDLSSGNLGISDNALPIPKVGIAITDYTKVPFTNRWLQFKGTFAHGWLGHNRYIKDSYYHEKTLFLRFGAGNLKFYVGAEHFAEWGGKRNGQSLGGSPGNFWNAVLLKETSASPEKSLYSGDHRGVLDGGVDWENNDVSLHGYVQKPFEGKNDIGLGTINGLAGVVISLKNKYMGLQKILFEVINTKDINNHIPANQRESYYNNNIYKTGWEYQDQIIGTPLFMNRARGANYFPEIAPFNWNAPDSSIDADANIINNRIFALHVGAMYSITTRLDGKTLLTYAKNIGSPIYGYLFSQGKSEIYCLQQVSYELPMWNININAGIGLDFGELSHYSVGE